MRQALNNLQSTHNGFGIVNSENVFKVCDEPHPLLIKDMLNYCIEGEIRKAYKVSMLITVSIIYFMIFFSTDNQTFVELRICS